MLVLSRKIGERINIGSDIAVEVRRVVGNRVTLAIDAPKNVRILRGELKVTPFNDAVIEHCKGDGDALEAGEGAGGLSGLGAIGD